MSTNNRKKIKYFGFDADRTLWSDLPAFEEMGCFLNEILRSKKKEKQYTTQELLSEFFGKGFEFTLPVMNSRHALGLSASELSAHIAQEVTRAGGYLASVVQLADGLEDVLTGLFGPEGTHREAVRSIVSSAHPTRVGACALATRLNRFIPEDELFCTPGLCASKPNKRIYRIWRARKGVDPNLALVVEDSPSGAKASIEAGLPTVGIVQLWDRAEWPVRVRELFNEGVKRVMPEWNVFPQILAIEEGDPSVDARLFTRAWWEARG